jgi:rhodanese-related sulfurtransferase
MVQQGEPFQRLNVDQAKSLYDKQGEVWIDVREPAEWQRGRIPGT